MAVLMTTIIPHAPRVTASYLRTFVGQRVRYELRGQSPQPGWRFPGRTGTGVITEVKGRNICFGEADWQWFPDIVGMETIS